MIIIFYCADALLSTYVFFKTFNTTLKVYIYISCYLLLFVLSFSVLSLNARGLRNNVKRKALFLFAKQFKTDFVFFQESHSQAKDVHFWRAQWGNDIWCAHGTEFSAGVCCLKNNFTGDILHTECDTQGHFVFRIVKVNDSVCLITNIYGFNSTTENNKLLDKLEEQTLFWLSKFPNANVIIGG